MCRSLNLGEGTILYVGENGFTLDNKKAVENGKIECKASVIYSEIVKVVGKTRLTKLINKNNMLINEINEWLNELAGVKAYYTKTRLLNEVYKC